MDVLTVINALNTSGPGLLGGAGEGENPTQKIYVDVNADGALSAMDALLIINYINGLSKAVGEGEAAPIVLSNRVADSLTILASSGVDIGPTAKALLASQTETNEGAACGAMDWASLGSGEGEGSLEDLLDTLAPEIQSTWKRK
jgi:hypothetical protein